MLRVKSIFVFTLVTLVPLCAADQRNNAVPIINLHDSPFKISTSTCKEVDWVEGKRGTLTKVTDILPFMGCWTITLKKVEFITIRVADIFLPPSGNIYPVEKCSSSNNYLSFNPSRNVPSQQYIDSDFYQNDFSDYSIDDSIFLCSEVPKRVSYTFQAQVLKIVFSIHENYLPSVSSGFSLNYEIAETCGTNVEIYSYDFILSPGFPNYPSGGTECTWRINLHPSSSHLPIQFSLSAWEVGLLNTSSLTFYDGMTRQHPVLAKYFSNTPRNVYESVVSSSGQQILVEFEFKYSPEPYLPGQHGFNATFKVQGYCLPGSRPCGDGKNCFLENQACNRHRDCENGNDELGCYKKGCTGNEFWCGSDFGECYSSKQRCDGFNDCKSKMDEMGCDSCTDDAYYCKASKRCIIARYKCDGERDCNDSEDEEGCSYVTSRRVITAAIVGSLICGWLLAIALGCSCKLYSLRNSSPGYRHGRFSLSTPLGHVARTLLQREAPPSYNMAVDGVETSESSRSRSSSRRERRRRRRNREPHIRRAQPAPRESEVPTSNNLQENNRTDAQVSAETTTASHQSRSLTATRADESSRTCAEQPQSRTNNDDDVPFILAEMGLAEFPGRTNTEASTAESTSTSPLVPETSPASVESSETSRISGSNAPADEEPQAPPLPIKKRIRPVMVEAPFNAVLADEIPACVYPNPPSYSEALSTGEPQAMPVVSVQTQKSELPPPKSPKRAKELLTKLWPNSNPKTRKFWTFSSITDVFSSNSPARSLRRPNTNISLDEDQVQLIDEFANEDSQSLMEYRSSMNVVEEEFVSSSDSNCFNLMPVQRSSTAIDLNSSQSSLNQSSSTVDPTDTFNTTPQSPEEPEGINTDSNDPFELRISGEGSSSHSDVSPVDATAVASTNSSPISPQSSWSHPVRVTIPEIRLETPDRLLTLNISGSLSERT